MVVFVVVRVFGSLLFFISLLFVSCLFQVGVPMVLLMLFFCVVVVVVFFLFCFFGRFCNNWFVVALRCVCAWF